MSQSFTNFNITPYIKNKRNLSPDGEIESIESFVEIPLDIYNWLETSCKTMQATHHLEKLSLESKLIKLGEELSRIKRLSEL